MAAYMQDAIYLCNTRTQEAILVSPIGHNLDYNLVDARFQGWQYDDIVFKYGTDITVLKLFRVAEEPARHNLKEAFGYGDPDDKESWCCAIIPGTNIEPWVLISHEAPAMALSDAHQWRSSVNAKYIVPARPAARNTHMFCNEQRREAIPILPDFTLDDLYNLGAAAGWPDIHKRRSIRAASLMNSLQLTKCRPDDPDLNVALRLQDDLPPSTSQWCWVSNETSSSTPREVCRHLVGVWWLIVPIGRSSSEDKPPPNAVSKASAWLSNTQKKGWHMPPPPGPPVHA